MRLKPAAACVLLAVTSACGGEQGGFYSTAPTPPRIVGSGRMVSESRAVQGFHTVVVGGAVRAVVTFAADDRLEITAEDNLLDLIETAVAGGRLTIGWRPGTGSVSSHGVVCRIGVRDLHGVVATGAGRFEVAGIDAQDFAVDLSGASSFAGSGTVERLRVNVSGASQVDAPELTARFANALLSGASVVRLRVDEVLVASASGASLLEYFGDPSVQTDTSGGSIVRRIGR